MAGPQQVSYTRRYSKEGTGRKINTIRKAISTPFVKMKNNDEATNGRSKWNAFIVITA
jgi:hypothetical protein